MSFGFSVGDFISAASLIKDLITCLSSSFLSSSSSYQELVLELQGLKSGLERIENLQAGGAQQLRVDGIKLAALNCQSILQDFLSKIKKYDASLGFALVDTSVVDLEVDVVATGDHIVPGNASGGSNVSKMFKKARKKVKTVERKIEWEVRMTKEVETLRGYLVAHVGNLNLSLSALGLEAVFRENGQTQLFRQNVTARLGTIEESSISIQKGLTKQDVQLQHHSDISYNILESLQGSVTSQLQSLLDLAQKVSTSNIDIVTYISKLQNTAQPPDLRYTWVQEPVKFEDALGRIIPVPSEYDVETLYSIISTRFRTGPGQKEVHSGMFELFNSLDANETISPITHDQLLPGMEITMAIIVGRYGKIERCPRPNCLSKDFAQPTFGLICRRCKIAFSKAKTQLPRPLRPSNFDSHKPSISNRCSLTSAVSLQKSNAAAELWRKTVQDQQKFKHLRIFVSELPATPQNLTPRKPRYHSRAKEKLEATEIKAEKTFTGRLAPNTKLSSRTIFERSPNSPPPENPIHIGAAPTAVYTTNGQPKSLSNMTPSEHPTPSAPPLPAIETPPHRHEGSPTGDFTSQTNPTKQHAHQPRSPNSSKPPNPPPSTAPHEHFPTPANPPSPRSIISAPPSIFANWDTFSSYTSRSNASAPGAYNEHHSTLTGIDLNTFIISRLHRPLDAELALDRIFSLQARTSGHLNAKLRELLTLQDLARARLVRASARFKEEVAIMRELRGELKWVHRRMGKLLSNVQTRFPNELSRADCSIPKYYY